MSTRLTELQRQRALLQEHLAWLDREIARETGGKTAAPVPVPPAPLPPPPPPKPPAFTFLTTPPASLTTPIAQTPPSPEDKALMAQFGYDPTSSQSDVRRGCWIVFIGAFVAIGLVILGWWLLQHQPA